MGHQHPSLGAYTDYAAAVSRVGTEPQSHAHFKTYVSQIVWEADNDYESFPLDSYHVWCVEGSGSLAGSLSSLGSAASRRGIDRSVEEEEDSGGFVYNRLSQWGPKFRILSDMYDRPQLALTYRDNMAYIQRSHSHDLLPHPQ